LSTAPDIDEYTYDGAGRQVEDTSVTNSTAISTAVTVYNGDSTTVIPGIPAASVATGTVPANSGTIQTTTVNPLGETTSLTQYTANPTLHIPSSTTTGAFYITGGTGSTTSYAYDAMGDQVQESLAGATWKQAFNLLGQQTSSTDATGGTTTMSYDADGNLTQAKDPAGNYLSWTYDEENRKTAEYNSQSGSANQHAYGTTGANQLASWVYDDANGAAGSSADTDGQATTVTSYANNHAYVVQQIGFTAFGESTGEKFTFDASAPGAGLGTPSSSGTTTSLQFINIYEPIDGELTKQSFPAAGGLPAETVTHSTVGALDLPGITGGNNGYAAAASYTAWSQPEQVTLGSGSNEATVTYAYDPRTGNLTDQSVKKSGNAAVDETSYAYSPAGALTSETDERNGSSTTSETQCFAYTTNGQLAQAWTATDACKATPTTSSFSTVGDSLGTSSEYDKIWSYTSLDQTRTEASLVPSAKAYATTTDTYSNSAELTSTATTGATTGSATYTYNADGEQATRSPLSGQTLAWDGQGDLNGVTKTSGGAAVAGYVYDAGGNLLTQTEGTKTTMYLPGEQLTIDTSTSTPTLSGVRFYSLSGGITAVRTGSGTAYGFELQSDQHGTNTLYLNNTAQTPTWRQFDPYGTPRGTAPAAGTFPGSRGFLNDPNDTATGLTSIGARWYDPATGTFASLDPLLEKASPAQLNGYTYAGANPIDSSDPTGLIVEGDGCNGSACYNGSQTGGNWNVGGTAGTGGSGGAGTAATGDGSSSGGPSAPTSSDLDSQYLMQEYGNTGGSSLSRDLGQEGLGYLGSFWDSLTCLVLCNILSAINGYPTSMTPTGAPIFGNSLTTPPFPLGDHNDPAYQYGHNVLPVAIGVLTGLFLGPEGLAGSAESDVIMLGEEPALDPEALVNQFKANPPGGPIGANRSMAGATWDINGVAGQGVTVSGRAARAGTLGMPANPIFAATRGFDAEQKILENIAQGLPLNSTGTVNLYISPGASVDPAEPICPSCQGVISQFQQRFPGITLNYTTG
jgi:RHS repeat-associated protein